MFHSFSSCLSRLSGLFVLAVLALRFLALAGELELKGLSGNDEKAHKQKSQLQGNKKKLRLRLWPFLEK